MKSPVQVKSAPPSVSGSVPAQRTPTSYAEQQGIKEPLLGEVKPMPSASSPKTFLCVMRALYSFLLQSRNVRNLVFYIFLLQAFLVMFFLGSFNWKLSGIHQNDMKLENPTGGMVFHIRRKLLKAKRQWNGLFLGWGMVAIYLIGSLPQICLNGLNPLLFVFSLVGNATYVASILVKSLDWSKIKPNMPWLVDAGGCMLLDTFILIQFIYFRYRSTSKEEKSRD